MQSASDTLKFSILYTLTALSNPTEKVIDPYDAREIKKLPDSENPLNQVNQYCRLLKLFLKAHSGFIRDDMQDYLNLYCFIMNPPNDKHLKVENFMNLAFDCRILHRYRD